MDWGGEIKDMIVDQRDVKESLDVHIKNGRMR